MDGLMDRGMDGGMDRAMDGGVDGWLDRSRSTLHTDVDDL